MRLSTTKPANAKTLRTFEPYSAVQVSEALDRGVAAFREHYRTSFAERATRMRKAAGILNAECRELGRLMTVEMGKPIKAATAEAEKCATACNYYVENAEKFLADQPVRMEGGESWVTFQPVGVVLANMQWNFPFWHVFRFAAPSLLAVDFVILKHTSHVQQYALATQDIIRLALVRIV